MLPKKKSYNPRRKRKDIPKSMTTTDFSKSILRQKNLSIKALRSSNLSPDYDPVFSANQSQNNFNSSTKTSFNYMRRPSHTMSIGNFSCHITNQTLDSLRKSKRKREEGTLTLKLEVSA